MESPQTRLADVFEKVSQKKNEVAKRREKKKRQNEKGEGPSWHAKPYQILDKEGI